MTPLLPSPDQLAEHPELAALHILQVALAASEHALLAEYPALQQCDYLVEAPPLCVATYFAEVVLRALAELETSVSRYRELLERLSQRRSALRDLNGF